MEGWDRSTEGQRLRARACRGLAVLLAAGTVACAPERPERPVDVVLVLVDTLRPDHLGFHGYARETAPFLAELARAGTVFTQARSTSSWTAPATSSVLTGLYPLRHGVTLGMRAQRERREGPAGDPSLPFQRLPADLPTLAERLSEAGHRTYAVTSNVNLGPELGLLRGFAHTRHDRGADARAIAAHVRDWRAELRSDRAPYFLYLHYMDPHGPYHPREPWYQPAGELRGDVVAAYDSEIGFFDRAFRELHADLGWAENTLLVILSDHGEAFWERGKLGHEGGLHAELNDVLMLWHGPGVGARVVSAPASLVDVAPTLLDWLGLDGGLPSDGHSLAPTLRGEPAEAADRALFAHRQLDGGHVWAAMDPRWKLMVGPEGRALYDRDADPGEKRDVGAAHPEVRARLTAALEAHRSPGIREAEAVRVELDAELRDALEALGYVGDAEPAP